MLVALILFLSGFAVGLYGRVLAILALSGLVGILSVVVWTGRGDLSVVGVLVLFGHLAALQAGYLLGAYLRVRADGT